MLLTDHALDFNLGRLTSRVAAAIFSKLEFWRASVKIESLISDILEELRITVEPATSSTFSMFSSGVLMGTIIAPFLGGVPEQMPCSRMRPPEITLVKSWKKVTLFVLLCNL